MKSEFTKQFQLQLQLCKKCVEFLKMSERAGNLSIRTSKTFIDMIFKHYLFADKELQLHEIKEDTPLPMNVFVLLWEARWCFLHGMYAATVSLSSAAVEVAINSDLRMKTTDPKNERWLNLGLSVLKKASRSGLPINHLLSEGEDLDVLDEGPEFVTRRNKVAHGEIDMTSHLQSFVSSEDSEKDAMNHLRDAQNFIFAWSSSEGNPINSKSDEIPTRIPIVVSTKLLTGFFPYDEERWLPKS